MATALSTNEVTVLFNDVLFRGATVDGVTEAVVGAGEIAPWASGLDAGFFTLAQVTNAFVTSSEAMTFVDPIIRMYQAAFARAPDQGGLVYWVTQEHTAVSNGISLANEQIVIAQGFAGSAEFITDYGLGGTINPVSFINSLYLHVLGRAADTQGLVFWEGVLGNTPTIASEANVLLGFVNSTEFINDTQSTINNFLTAIANSALATTTATTLGTATFPTTLSLPASSFTLTTGADHVSGFTNVFGDLTPFNFNGIGPTLNSDDVISNVTNLIITDDFAPDSTASLNHQGDDIFPAGVSLSNIANVVLDTAGNAGEGGGAPLDTTVITGSPVQTLTVNSTGNGVDFINAGQQTAIVDNQSNTFADIVTTVIPDGSSSISTSVNDGAGAVITGGSSVTVVSSGGGGVLVGNTTLGAVPTAAQVPTGAVSITEKSTSTGGVSVEGGTSVTVTVTSTTNTGEIDIGNTDDNTGDSVLGSIANPTGNVTVMDSAIFGGTVYVFGGTTVNVTASGDEIKIGDSGFHGIDDDTIDAASNEPTGNVTVVDTAPSALTETDATQENIDVRGGANISITTNTGDVHVGTDTLNDAGTAPLQATEPTGSVTVIDTSTYVYTHVDVYGGINPGGTAVTITASGAFIKVGAIEDGVVFAPTGNVMITNTAPVVFDDIVSSFNAFGSDGGFGDQIIRDIGGVNVQITTNAGGVVVGQDSPTPLVNADPSGNVTIIDTATGLGTFGGGEDGDPGDIEVYGGVNINITAASGSIFVGDGSAANPSATPPTLTSDPTGTVTINESGVNTGYDYFNEITALGGTNIVINTTGAGGGIVVGTEEELGGTPVTGTVAVTDTYSGQHHESISVIGGTTVSVSTTATTNTSIPTTHEDLIVGGDPGSTFPGGEFVFLGGTVTLTVASQAIAGGSVTVTYSGLDATLPVNAYQEAAAIVQDINDTPALEAAGITAALYDTTSDPSSPPVFGIIEISSPVTDDATYSGTTTIPPSGGFGPSSSPDYLVAGTSGTVLDDFNPSTVTIDQPNSIVSGAVATIDVGVAPIENFAGTALTNTADDPTGNVTINDSSTFGTTTVYGTESFNIYTNGATSVTVTGGSGDDDIIEDVESALLSSLLPAGKSTLTSITLDGVSDADFRGVVIIDNALTTLSIANVSAAGLNIDIENTAVSTSGLTLDLSNVSEVTVNDDTPAPVGGPPTIAGNVTINSSGTIATEVDLNLPIATSLTFNNSNTLYFDPTIPDVTTITATGSGTLILGDLGSDGTLTKINAATATGGVHVHLDPLATSFVGGAGNDVVFLGSDSGTGETLGTGVTLSGGGGTNTIYAEYASNAADISLGALPLKITGFQDLGVDDAASGTYNAVGFAQVDVGNFDVFTNGFNGVAGGIIFTNIEQGAVLDLVDAGDNEISYELNTGYSTSAPAGTAAVTIVIGMDGATAHGPTSGTGVQDDDAFVDIFSSTTGTNNINALTVNTQGFVDFLNTAIVDNIGGANYNALAIDAGSTLAAITITGDQALILNVSGGPVSSINAGTSTAPFIFVTDIELSTKGVAITGGTGAIFADGFNGAVTVKDAYTLGTGGGYITLGSGDAGTVISGGETVTLTAPASQAALLSGTTIEVQTITATEGGSGSDSAVNLGTRAAINNWSYGTIATGPTPSQHQTADSIVFENNTPIVLRNSSNDPGAGGGADLAVYTVSGGVATQTSGPQPSGSQELLDVQSILDNTSGVVAGTIVMVQVPAISGPNPGTFVLEYGTGGVAADTILEFNNFIGATSFGATVLSEIPQLFLDTAGGTSMMIGTDSVDSLFRNLTANDKGSLTGSVTYSVGTDTNSVTHAPFGLVNIDSLINSVAGFTNTYTNLANWAVLEASDTESSGNQTDNIFDPVTSFQGNVVVTQPGIDPVITINAFSQDTSAYNAADSTLHGAGQVNLNTFTYGNKAVANDDPLLVLDASSGSITINTVTDASNTGTTIVILGEFDVQLNTINDTALNTINAANFTGDLSLGDGPLPQNGLNISVFTDVNEFAGNSVILVSGANDVIQIGYQNTALDIDNRPGGSLPTQEILATGNNNTISTYSHYDGAVFISASGLGDTITVVGAEEGVSSSNNTCAGGFGNSIACTLQSPEDLQTVTIADFASSGTHEGPAHTDPTLDNAAGANAIINVGTATGSPTEATMWVGENTTINIVDPSPDGSHSSTYANIWVTGAVTTAADLMTTINTPQDQVSNITLFWYNQPTNGTDVLNGGFEGWAGGGSVASQVNVATATTLIGALNLAASQEASIDQYFNNTGGSTNATHSTATATSVEINAHTSLVDWFQFGGNTYIVEANNTTAAAATHATLAANDVVVELTGIVDVNHITMMFA